MRVNGAKPNIIERMSEALNKSKYPTSITLTQGEWVDFLYAVKQYLDSYSLTAIYPSWLKIDEEGYYFKGYPVLVEQ